MHVGLYDSLDLCLRKLALTGVSIPALFTVS